MGSARGWQEALPGVLRFEDSCNVYAVRGPQGTLIVNAGTGQWLDHLDGLPGPLTLACTHYFRDHSAGAARAARQGIPVYVPEGEEAVFADPEQHFRERQTYIIYDNLWDLFAPIEPIPVAGALKDYDTVSLAGLEISVVPLPGVTLMQCGLELRLPTTGQKVVFCGEAIHSPGRLARIAPLQYNYNDLSGAINCHLSAQTLRDRQPDALLPSLGQPILRETDAALARLQASLEFLCKDRPGESAAIADLAEKPLEKVTDHVWMAPQSVSINWFVLSESGKALVLDYGYSTRGVMLQGYPTPQRRRALLHSVGALKQQFGIDRIDVALISHFHDDHVCGVPVLQRVFGTECWASEAFADLLASPEAHCFPCDWPTPCRIDRRLPVNGTAQWEEYTFRFGPMSGHTRFAALIGFEADGKRFAHTGDQYFFQKGVGDWANNPIAQNHVYRNGALLDGYRQSGDWMLAWRPDIVISGHQPPMHTDADYFRRIADWSEEYAQLHERAMALGADETHFNLDSWGGWIWPYRTHLTTPGTARVQVTVRNPFPHPAQLEVRLVGPPGWEGTGATLPAEGRAEVRCELAITPNGPCRRQPFAVELTADGRPFGQVAEALLTVGGERF
ncbi:MAG TPA: MBL fold metallo-hydrolase [Chthonomonadaceae bacterium]|nr:MBL fold metallo-hydrolase [Chthonomonadaceae bacterium]